MVMDTLSSNQALTLFGKWERENKSIVLLFSTPAAAMSFKNGKIVPFVDDCLMLSFGEDNILRIFLQAAKFWHLEAEDIPEESRGVVPKFEQCVRIISENPELQCFLCATSPIVAA
jgi:hypothetical protein